jgi:hypothetical protein
MSNENFALYWLAVMTLAACFSANDSSAWIGFLIIVGGLVVALAYGVAVRLLMLFGVYGKKKRKAKEG